MITDGVTSVPDVAVCETLLNQLRSGTVACSFVQVRTCGEGGVGSRVSHKVRNGRLLFYRRDCPSEDDDMVSGGEGARSRAG